MPKLRPDRPKNPPKEKTLNKISSDESLFTFSFSPDRFNKGEKRGHPQTSPDKNQNQNQKPIKKDNKTYAFYS